MLPFLNSSQHLFYAVAGAAAGNQSEAGDRGSLQLELRGLSLDNVDALEALKLNIQVTAGPFCAQDRH